MAKACNIIQGNEPAEDIAIEIAGPLTVKLTAELHKRLQATMMDELTAWPLANLEIIGDRAQVVLGLNLTDAIQATVDLEELLDEFAEHYGEQAGSDAATRKVFARAVANLRSCADRLEQACQGAAKEA